jgi:predicted MPP superfamily phosphohydrolase
MMTGSDGGGPPFEQDELPFGVDFRAAGAAGVTGAGQSRWLLVAHRSLAILRRLPVWLLRWALRLALPVGGAATMVHLFPYHTTAAGLHFRVQASVLTKPGISADTSFGNWQFPHVDGLPVGVHVSPENLDLLRLTELASSNSQAFTDSLRSDLSHQLPEIAWWIGGETLLGVLLGLAVAAGFNMAGRYLRNRRRSRHELRRRSVQLLAALVVVAALAGYGVASYNPHWDKQSRLTGTLGAVQLVPEQLEKFYNHQSKAFDVINAIAAIQAQLQDQIGSSSTPATSFNIMYISDMHLASTYPLVQQYAQNFNVKLIVNTGDETEFGSNFELSDTYLDQIRSITKTIPMIWLAGNHDSPDTVDTMRTVPGVTVLGTKSQTAGGGYDVTAQDVMADGLLIGGVPDPRVYGASGVYGSDKTSDTDPLERQAVDTAVAGISRSTHFDIFATHEPVAAQRLVKDLPGQIRQINAGHTHAQNDEGTVQVGNAPINLVEGSTGAGGLDALNSSPPPIEFSIESVASDCQFTKIVRFQLTGVITAAGNTSSTVGQHVTAATIYFRPQDLDQTRFCSPEDGIFTVQDLGKPAG